MCRRASANIRPSACWNARHANGKRASRTIPCNQCRHQRALREQNYRYQPREAVVRERYQPAQRQQSQGQSQAAQQDRRTQPQQPSQRNDERKDDRKDDRGKKDSPKH